MVGKPLIFFMYFIPNLFLFSSSIMYFMALVFELYFIYVIVTIHQGQETVL